MYDYYFIFPDSTVSEFELVFNKTLWRLLNNLSSCAAAQRDRKGTVAGQMGTNTGTCRRGITNTLLLWQTALQADLGMDVRTCVRTTALCIRLSSSGTSTDGPEHPPILPSLFLGQQHSQPTGQQVQKQIPLWNYQFLKRPQQNGCSTAEHWEACPKREGWQQTDRHQPWDGDSLYIHQHSCTTSIKNGHRNVPEVNWHTVFIAQISPKIGNGYYNTSAHLGKYIQNQKR